MASKKLQEFIKHSKRLMSATKEQYHIRYIRKGEYREFYVILENEDLYIPIGKKRREKAYDPRYIKKLTNKIQKEYGERARKN